jgi:hypothetical protein
MESPRGKQRVRVREVRYIPRSNVLSLILIGLIFLIGLFWSYVFFGMDVDSVLTSAIVLLVIYVVLILVLLRTRTKKVIDRTRTNMPVIQEIKRQVIEKPKKTSRRTPKFVASTDGKTYHLSSSRTARMIKTSNRIYSNSNKSLENKGYKPSREVKEYLDKKKKK